MSQLMFWNKQSSNNNNNSSSSSSSSNNNNNNNNNNNSNNSSSSNNNSNNNNHNNHSSSNSHSNNNNNGNSNNNNNNINGINSNGSTIDAKGSKRNWLHTPDALVNGHIVFLVKFFGNLPVEQAKGIEVVKDAIRKLQFAQQMKKAETGTQEKFKKVEITISVDGVAVQEPRTQNILHQFPLHNISYCADDKGVKKFFSFIAKSVKPATEANGNGVVANNGSTTSIAATETHECFVFISNKLASDITLTIGQAFDLAYRKYISSAEKTDLSKAQQMISDLEKNITIYRNRLRDVSQKLPKTELSAMLFKMGISDILELPRDNGAITNGNSAKLSVNNDDKLLIDTTSNKSSSSSSSSSYVPIVPPRNNLSSQILSKASSQKMDELLLNSDSDSDFDPRANESMDSGSSNIGGGRSASNDLFGFEPSKTYGQQLFQNINGNKLPINNNNNNNSNNTINMNNNNNNNNSNGSSIGNNNIYSANNINASAITTTTNNNNNNNSSNNSSNNNNNIINNHNNNGTIISNNGFSNELSVAPGPPPPPAPLLAPPPKVAAPRRSVSVTNNVMNGSTDLFGSDPFDVNGASIFKNKLNSLSVDDFSLESLDPLRK